MLEKEAPQMDQTDWSEARTFCLRTIKEVYGIDYNPKWHQDLDDMGTAQNVYLPENGGWFLLARNESGDVIGCSGLRVLSSRQDLYDLFKHRWMHPDKVGALWRAYVSAEYRGQGLGQSMKGRLVTKARELGYDYLYLHASKANPVAVIFGKTFGFTPFKEDPDGTVHMEKRL